MVSGTGKTPGSEPLDQVRLVGVTTDVTVTVRSSLRPWVCESSSSVPGDTARLATSTPLIV
ncbi:Uncharacterised protein [Mycobacterium tuberculosis]|uniref:Uncharacterized protein n=1 Tax=Mycobacterium tuberculosis TaxID=1773 RepID=A0A654TQN6_MYCTX|nr:Uncharacterised protein [Mycobacterium tuberculosis]CFS57243.1 Uncharacterised protein [Mycobacterium tuberculosis]COW95408.1 Uncharacterised protein [Mycobacterium tuberculosis]COX52867.1 Uncharacterised protein [Mycobacterium tuberculosis]COY96056.1 Uncharacterised protein [Mycobacterium tuberculosis]